MAHIHTLYDFVVSAYIVHANRVLMVYHTGLQKWLPVGGHIELDEDPEEALFREIYEETGLVKNQLILYSDYPSLISEGTKFLSTPSYLDVHVISNIHKHIGFTYLLKSSSAVITRNVREHNDIQWFDEKKLNDPLLSLSPATMFYAKEALRIINARSVQLFDKHGVSDKMRKS